MLKCWQGKSVWKREEKDKMRIELKPVLIRQNHSLALFWKDLEKQTGQNASCGKDRLSCFEMEANKIHYLDWQVCQKAFSECSLFLRFKRSIQNPGPFVYFSALWLFYVFLFRQRLRKNCLNCCFRLEYLYSIALWVRTKGKSQVVILVKSSLSFWDSIENVFCGQAIGQLWVQADIYSEYIRLYMLCSEKLLEHAESLSTA